MNKLKVLSLIKCISNGYKVHFFIRIRYRSCYVVKIDDVVVDTRLYVYPPFTDLQSKFAGDTGTDGLASITLFPPYNNQVSLINVFSLLTSQH